MSQENLSHFMDGKMEALKDKETCSGWSADYIFFLLYHLASGGQWGTMAVVG